jgi:hypothetical protein
VGVRDHRDLVIADLARSEAALRERVDQLIGIIATIAFENGVLHRLFERELLERIHAEGRLDQYRRRDRTAPPNGQVAA